MDIIGHSIKYAGIKRLMLIAVFACALLPGYRECSAQTGGGNTGPTYGNAPVTDPDHQTVQQYRYYYGQRNPFAAASMQADTLQSAGAGNLQQSAPGTTTPVMTHSLFIKYCNDNPMQGVCYYQPLFISAATPAAARDSELFQNRIATGLTIGPISDTQFQIIDRENKQRYLELLFDPERWMWTMHNSLQMTGASMSNHIAGGAETNFESAMNNIAGTNSGFFGTGSPSNMINIANENSGIPTNGDPTSKSLPQAVYMVQRMYASVFIPMAILFLLPGAILTQTKGLISRGFMGSGSEEVASPFDGILRSMVAVFLIPGTQLIISYSIDVGNTMANSVYPWINLQAITQWFTEQTYNPPPLNSNNAILPPQPSATSTPPAGSGGAPPAYGGTPSGPSELGAFAGGAGAPGGGGFGFGGVGWGITIGLGGGGGFGGILGNIINWIDWLLGIGGPLGFDGGQGKVAQMPETSTIQEQQSWLSQTVELVFNFVEFLFTFIVARLTEFQVLLLCYLFLLGPLCAAFFAWPMISQSTFRGVLSNWINAVVSVSLWRFYWCVILAIMSQRLSVTTALGVNTNSEFEMMVFVCFLGLMMVVPFSPFTFQPGDTAVSALMRGTQAAGIGMKAAGMSNAQINQVLGPMNQLTGTWMQTFYAQSLISSPGLMNNLNSVGMGGGGMHPSSNGQNTAVAPPTSGNDSGNGYPVAPYLPPPTGSPLGANPAGYSPNGSRFAQTAPPVGAAPSSAAPTLAAAQQAAGSSGPQMVSYLPPTAPPTVQLSPPGAASFLLAANNPGHAAAGVAAYRSAIPNLPGTTTGAPPVTGNNAFPSATTPAPAQTASPIQTAQEPPPSAGSNNPPLPPTAPPPPASNSPTPT